MAKGEYSWVLTAGFVLILAKLIYEILGVVYSSLIGETRAILAFIAAFYAYGKIGKRIEKLI